MYDPACGSGSLLLKAVKVLGHDAVRNGFFGQEINITTYNLCRINMFLHDIGFDKFSIACEDTLTNPQHWDDEPFELIVSNPPYSIKWAGDSNPLLINGPPLCARRCAGSQEQSRPGVYHAQLVLVGIQWYRRYRLLPRHLVPGWGGEKEDPPVSHRQQLY